MLHSIILATFISLIIFVTIENIKKEKINRKIKLMNEKLRVYISDYLGDIKALDVFIVKQLREKIREDLMGKDGIEGFELMMLNSSHIKIAYEIDGEREEIEVTMVLDKIEINKIKDIYEIEEYDS